MKRKVVFIHTVDGLKPLFEGLLTALTDQADAVHIADETLIRAILAAQGLTPAVRARLREHVRAADRFGAEFIQFTCSTISPCGCEMAGDAKGTILTVDAPVAAEIAARFQTIGVIATNPATLDPSTQLVRDTAAGGGRTVRVESVLCPGAYAAYLQGDMSTHDRIVTECLAGLMQRVDAVLLAQASMARIADLLPAGERRARLFSSPQPAMKHLAHLLGQT